ncbi:MAG: dicarboxylate/amino acid:cation symporter [Chlamydiia bacterium]|nr:dicarboxylate/amino acid:cation symporter [Chlamydiia bacterium]
MKPWLKILVGLVLGIITGLILFKLNKSQSVLGGTCNEFLTLVGKAFIDLLKMLVGLIVFSSLVVGMCHISDPKKMGRIGLTTIIFYVVTTLIAIGIGLVVVFSINPGAGMHQPIPAGHQGGSGQSLIDFLFSIVPSNPFASFAENHILQIIVFGVFFAIAINLAGEKGKLVLKYIESLSEIMARLTAVVMKFAPYGVFALMATAVGVIGEKFLLLFSAVGCIFIAALVQIALIFTVALRVMANVGIGPFFKGMKDAIVVAFTTSSSSATLPVSLECARDHLGLSSDISGFVLSLGSTINMNGTAIGQTVLAVFIAQAYGIEVGFTSIIILIFTTLVSAIGTAGIPGSGLVMLSIVLSAMGLPPEGIGLVAGIDRLRDMIATVVNILGDAVAAVYVAKKENQIDLTKYHQVTWIE